VSTIFYFNKNQEKGRGVMKCSVVFVFVDEAESIPSKEIGGIRFIKHLLVARVYE